MLLLIFCTTHVRSMQMQNKAEGVHMFLLAGDIMGMFILNSVHF